MIVLMFWQNYEYNFKTASSSLELVWVYAIFPVSISDLRNWKM